MSPTGCSLLTREQVEATTQMSRSTLYKLMRSGNFPEPLQVTTQSVRWRSDEVQAWIDSLPRAAGRGAA